MIYFRDLSVGKFGKSWLALLWVFVVAMLCPLSQIHAVLIDGFDVSQARLQLTATGDIGNQVSSVATGATNLYGGKRYLQITMTGGTAGQVTSADVTPSIYSFGQEPSVIGRGTIRYSGNDDETLNNLNLNLAGGDRFVFEFNYVDIAFTMNIVVTDSTGTKSCTAQPTINPVPLGPPTTPVPVLFSSCVGTFNFQTDIVGNIRLYWDTQGHDIQIADFDAPISEISCQDKRINGVSNYIVPESTVWPLVDLPITIVVQNSGDDGNVTIEDTLPTGMTYKSFVSCTPDILPHAPTPLGGNSYRWSSKGIGVLPAGQSLTLVFNVDQAEIPEGQTRQNCAIAYVAEETPPAACSDSDCIAYISRQTTNKVPSLNEWGMIILSLILAASAVWLVRRRRTS